MLSEHQNYSAQGTVAHPFGTAGHKVRDHPKRSNAETPDVVIFVMDFKKSSKSYDLQSAMKETVNTVQDQFSTVLGMNLHKMSASLLT